MARPTSHRHASGVTDVAEAAGAGADGDAWRAGAGYPAEVPRRPAGRLGRARAAGLRGLDGTHARRRFHAAAPGPALPAQAAQAAREGGIIAAAEAMLHRKAWPAAARTTIRASGRACCWARRCRRTPASAGAAARIALLGYQQAGRGGGRADAHRAHAAAGHRRPGSGRRHLQANARAFSLTEFANRLDLPSVSLPGDLRARQSIGLMLTGRGGDDRRVLKLAVAMERVLNDLDSARRERPAARHRSGMQAPRRASKSDQNISLPSPGTRHDRQAHSQDLTDTERHARGPAGKAGA